MGQQEAIDALREKRDECDREISHEMDENFQKSWKDKKEAYQYALKVLGAI
jgi:hypothetical protein